MSHGNLEFINKWNSSNSVCNLTFLVEKTKRADRFATPKTEMKRNESKLKQILWELPNIKTLQGYAETFPRNDSYSCYFVEFAAFVCFV